MQQAAADFRHTEMSCIFAYSKLRVVELGAENKRESSEKNTI